MRTRANYSHNFQPIQGRNCLIIIDEFTDANPTMSVTNCIEDVVEEIFNNTRPDFKPENTVIVYRDTENEWIGWDHKTQTFKPVSGNNGREAAQSYIERYEAVEC